MLKAFRKVSLNPFVCFRPKYGRAKVLVGCDSEIDGRSAYIILWGTTVMNLNKKCCWL